MKKEKIVIDVESVVGPFETALIVLHKTGVFYTAQCGGVACKHPESEGFVVSLGSFAKDFDTCQYGCANIGLPENKEQSLALGRGFDLYVAAQDSHMFAWKIRFDYARIDSTLEGWIPVVLNGKLGPFFDVVFEETPAFIHNGNCD